MILPKVDGAAAAHESPAQSLGTGASSSREDPLPTWQGYPTEIPAAYCRPGICKLGGGPPAEPCSAQHEPTGLENYCIDVVAPVSLKMTDDMMDSRWIT